MTVLAAFPDPLLTMCIDETTKDKGPEMGLGLGKWDQEITHSQAIISLGDIVESRDSGFILGLHTEVPIVSHKLQDNNNLR